MGLPPPSFFYLPRSSSPVLYQISVIFIFETTFREPMNKCINFIELFVIVLFFHIWDGLPWANHGASLILSTAFNTQPRIGQNKLSTTNRPQNREIILFVENLSYPSVSIFITFSIVPSKDIFGEFWNFNFYMRWESWEFDYRRTKTFVAQKNWFNFFLLAWMTKRVDLVQFDLDWDKLIKSGKRIWPTLWQEFQLKAPKDLDILIFSRIFTRQCMSEPLWLFIETVS